MSSELVISSQLNWEPIVLDGKTIEGIYSKTLRYAQDKKRPIRLLLKIEAGASYPAHNYPGGDELFVLEGEVNYGKYLLKKDDYLLVPPNPSLVVFSNIGCIMLFALAK
ncbi:MAG: cupin domain-containing protein [Bacteroidota bacterium]